MPLFFVPQNRQLLFLFFLSFFAGRQQSRRRLKYQTPPPKLQQFYYLHTENAILGIMTADGSGMFSDIGVPGLI